MLKYTLTDEFAIIVFLKFRQKSFNFNLYVLFSVSKMLNIRNPGVIVILILKAP